MEENGTKDTQSAGSEYGKEKADSQANIIVAWPGITLRCAFFLVTTNAVPNENGLSASRSALFYTDNLQDLLNTGVEMAVLVAIAFGTSLVVMAVVVMASISLDGGVWVLDKDLLAIRGNTVPNGGKRGKVSKNLYRVSNLASLFSGLTCRFHGCGSP